MDKFTALENAISDRLAPLVDRKLEVLNSPKKCPSAVVARCQFYLTGESAEPIKGATQNSTVKVTFAFQLCDPRSHKGAYPYICAIKLLLNRYHPSLEDFGRLEFENISYQPFTQENGTVWIYSLTFAIKSLEKENRINIDTKLNELFSGV